MPKSNTPYDPQPAREDALGELAREGYASTPGDHSARLNSLQDRLGLPKEKVTPTNATVRSLRPRRWLAIAAGIALLAVAGLALYLYDSPQEQIAQVVAPINTPSEQEALQDNPEVEVLSAEEQEPVANQNFSAPGQVEMDNEQRSVVKPSQTIEAPEKIAVQPTRPANPEGMSSSPTSTQKDDAAIATEDAGSPQREQAVAESPPAASNTASTEAAAETVARKKESNAAPSSADMLADEEVEKEAASFRMERVSAVETREVTGEVLEPSGLPVIGAVLTVEETGQQVITDQKGEFSILVTSAAVVGEMNAPGYNSLLFDLTAGEEFRLYLPRQASSLPSAQLKGKSIGLRLVAPKAESFELFDAYVSDQRSSFSGEAVTVQFEVNRFGRPRQITTGPGPQNRAAVKLLKDWLKSGPDWPEAYQRKSWRYTIVMP